MNQLINEFLNLLLKSSSEKDFIYLALNIMELSAKEKKPVKRIISTFKQQMLYHFIYNYFCESKMILTLTKEQNNLLFEIDENGLLDVDDNILNDILYNSPEISIDMIDDFETKQEDFKEQLNSKCAVLFFKINEIKSLIKENNNQ